MPPRIKISGYTSHKTEKGKMVPGYIPYATDFYTEMERIRDGYYKILIEHMRSIEDPEAKKAFKSGFLPSLTISAVCRNHRSLANITHHSGLLNIDIDSKGNEHVTDWAAERDRIFNKSQDIVCAFLSASGNGVTFVVRIVPDLHEDTFYSIGEAVQDHFGLKIDMVAKDASRLRFVSYDPELRIRYNFEELQVNKPTLKYWENKRNKRNKILSVLPSGEADSIGNFREAIRRTEQDGCSFYEGEKHKYLIHVAGYCNATGMSQPFCDKMVFKFFRHLTHISDEELLQPAKNVYRTYMSQFRSATLPQKPFVPIKLKRHFLNIVDKPLLKKYIFIYQHPYIKGQSDYTIKVDNKALVFLMWLIAPEYTWTCLDQPHSKYFTKEECKDLIPDGCILQSVNDSRVWVNKTLGFPANW